MDLNKVEIVFVVILIITLLSVAYFVLGGGIGLNVRSIRKQRVSKHRTTSP